MGMEEKRSSMCNMDRKKKRGQVRVTWIVQELGEARLQVTVRVFFVRISPALVT